MPSRSACDWIVSIAWPGRVLDEPLAPRAAGEGLVERELEPGEPAVIDARVAEHLRRQRSLRVEALLLRIEAEAGQLSPPQPLGPHRVGLARDVDEAVRAVAELGGEGDRVEPQDPRRDGGLAVRVAHLERIGVDRRRLLADRELEAAPVVDRPTRGRDRHFLAVLARRQAAVGARANSLQPRRPQERDPEQEDEAREQQPDAAIRDAGAGDAAQRARCLSRM